MRVAIEHARMLKIVRPKRSLSIRNAPPRRPGNDVKNFRLVRIRWTGYINCLRLICASGLNGLIPFGP